MPRKCKCGKRTPIYNNKGETQPLYCALCKSQGMINVRGRRCKCGTIPSYGIENATHCAKCKTKDMKLIKKQEICKECGKKAYYNYANESGKKYCIECKKEGMVSKVKKYKCKCGKEPYYNDPGERQGKYCKDCKKEGMINVRSKKCECGEGHPIYNLEGYPAEYCKKCKTSNMIDVRHKKCSCGSGELPYYGLEKGTNCVLCKTNGMKLIRQGMMCKKCDQKYNAFGYPGKSAEYCSTCKMKGMVNLRITKCVTCEKKDAFYNYEGHPRRYCKECKNDNMERYVPSVNKCVTCKKREAYYNVPEEQKAKYCGDCKTESMSNVRSRKCKCGKSTPVFNKPNEKQSICCAKCKTDEMVNVRHPMCMGVEGKCPLDSVANNKYRGYCAECFRRKYPLDPITFTIRAKTKEIAVRDFINANFEGFEHDTPMQTGHCDCTIRRRIDHRKIIYNTLIAIETDENQHKGYKDMDEETRYDDLYMAYSGKWIYIRFNPDKYVNKDGKKKNPSLSKRLEELKKEIEKQIERVSQEENKDLVERVYMYYDE